ncbi:MAG: BCCT family transporter [Bacillota bacterium]|nr:BCCT family transporter [Bacillota bacterium]
MENERKVPMDPRVFWPSLIVAVSVSAYLALSPESGGRAVDAAYSFVTANFGWLFLIAGMACFIVLLWLAFGRFGHVKLGCTKDEPEFSYFSWVAMMFCGGIGIGIMLWSITEPLFYLLGPPFHVEPGSAMSAEWAHLYGQFHWGFSAWAIYCIFAIPIAYAVYVRKDPHLRISTTCGGVIGASLAKGPLGVIIDIFVMFGIIGGVGTSLGLAVPLVSALFGNLFGVPDSFGLNMVVLLIWTAIFSISVYRGLDKGIKVLSNFNVYLALALIAFVLFAGPTVFIMSSWTNSLGLLLNNFFRMSFWTDPILKGGFPEAWTIFYWAWWFAYGPMFGLFVARISKGRTIREVILACLVWGTLGCWVYFAIFGGYSIYLDINGIAPVSQILSESGGPAAVIAVLAEMPLSRLVTVVYTILCFVFLATTLDSSAYVLASVASKDLKGDEQPARWNRLVWALVLAGLAIGLLTVGGLQTVQTSTIVVALPLIAVVVLLTMSLLKWLNEDFKDTKPKTMAVDYEPVTEESGKSNLE